MIGSRYGRLEVRGEAGKVNGHYAWECRCDCGAQVIIRGDRLKAARKKSCGCLQREAETRAAGPVPEESAFNKAFQFHCRRGKLRGWSHLPRPEWDEIVRQPCFYCGALDEREPFTTIYMKRKARDPRFRQTVRMNGVDRKDATQGYESKNCVPCCWECNKMKRELSVQDFVDRCRVIVTRLG